MCEQCETEQSSPLLENDELEVQDSDQPIMFFEPLKISTDNLVECENIQFDKDEFIRGLKDTSRVCGMYTALLNAGFSLDDAIAFIFNDQSIKNNIELAKIQSNAQIEVSKNKSVLVDNSQL